MRVTEKYIHHGNEVTVMSELKGKHRENCLCFNECIYFNSGEDNCEIAQDLYKLCCKHKLVTPVYECQKYESKAEARHKGRIYGFDELHPYGDVS